MRFSSAAELKTRRDFLAEARRGVKRRVIICAGTGCVAGGSLDVHARLIEQAREAGLTVEIALEACAGEHHKGNGGPDYISISGCHGFCQMGPLVHVMPDDILYCGVKVKDVPAIIDETLKKGEVIERLLYRDPVSKERKKGRDEITFYNQQHRLALEACGVIDPESIDDYLAHGGYQALSKALGEMKPDDVVDVVDKSGLRGRGGGGFPTGRKWRSCLNAPGDVRYVICNGDEGDPGAFMDRSIMEGDPFKVIEGMTLGGYALGSSQGYVYVRHEYPLAVKRMEKAIDEARRAGLLGENILDSGFSFEIKINRGGGAFVCGESSALMRSIEGYIGEPRPKYIHSTEKGLYDKPTVLNNVESWVCVTDIVKNGANWFASTGTEKSKGTKAFCLVGKVNNTGLIEVPMGISLRKIVEEIGGGIIGGKKFKAIQTGGPSGGCLPAEKLDLTVDFDTLTSAGSMMGSGGMIVMDERNCMVDVAKYFIEFLLQESCGKCVPCREGLQQMHVMLDRITKGEGREDDIERLESLARVMKKASLCALGQSAANPVLSTLRYFRDEYQTHITDRRCPAGVCKELITYSVNDNCNGCTLCLKNCPADAITGEKKKMHTIDTDKCTRCGACEAVCNQDAISVE
ncbi:MAG TPA: NADH-ubiquinone oxidoreductase-F iron-sulfur binding region domain-containing protein [Myxococcota bacterium]|nr:NADH-ubiquinone oxidoreductase-F iron-sulfur binding region domain-containing protein [Myxococcota bacterium]